MQAYSYEERHQKTLHSADSILSLVLQRIPAVTSAVDLGCGVGTWLSVLRAKGASEVLGMDGEWVDRKLLVIPQDSFRNADLSRLEPLHRRYDLSLSLEVAEHLSAERAEAFVRRLTELSDFVLFSAAVPGQGGRNHVNEQWPDYWVQLFAARGYDVHDFVRPQIWDDERIPYWYRQNILFFSRRERTHEVRQIGAAHAMPLRVIHPTLYLRQLQAADKGRVRLIPKSWRKYWKRKLRGDG